MHGSWWNNYQVDGIYEWVQRGLFGLGGGKHSTECHSSRDDIHENYKNEFNDVVWWDIWSAALYCWLFFQHVHEDDGPKRGKNKQKTKFVYQQWEKESNDYFRGFF